jgi:hypothetical protein
VAPSEIQIVVKTHRTALFVQIPLSSDVSSLKSSVLSALTQFQESGSLEGVPIVSSENDFELVKTTQTERGKYTPLEATKTVKQQGITNWTVLYLRFRDSSGKWPHLNLRASRRPLMPAWCTKPLCRCYVIAISFTLQHQVNSMMLWSLSQDSRRTNRELTVDRQRQRADMIHIALRPEPTW